MSRLMDKLDFVLLVVGDVQINSVTRSLVPHGLNFVQEHIIHWFGVPQSLTTDQGSSFMSY
jgi:hypothetical protein